MDYTRAIQTVRLPGAEKHRNTMITLILLLAMLQTGLSVIGGFEEVEKNLRIKLGLSQKPVINENIKIPTASMDLFNLTSAQKMTTHFPLPGLHTMSANTARIYPNKGSAPIKVKTKKYRVQFDIDSIPEREQVKAAEVRFTMKYDQVLQNGEIIHVILHDIIQPGIKGLSKPILRIIDSKSINISTISKTESFDATPFIERLLKNNFKGNHGMLVQCFTESGSHTHLLSVFDFMSPENTLLLVYTDDGTSQKSTLEQMIRRTKRSVGPSTGPKKKAKKTNCQRYSMYVNFKEIGFSNWIEAPSGYDAFYCDGVCKFPLAGHLNASNHALLQTRLNAINSALVPHTCCVPTKLSSQSLLYKDDNGKLVLKNFHEMTVDECGCR
ncbi:PREDICTED: protein decapentaplegic-like [Diuraphis noxia]|uniref:protein decapentaplegic-like n=1 Tax=Diuraphis noxia TaxID=143948 RepID=UPI0007639B23|nr:PREDICTED: protein decapentaplegic-like [Diuraphis noxia]